MVVGWVKVGFVVFSLTSNASFLIPITPPFSVRIFSPHIKGTKNAEINGQNRFFSTEITLQQTKNNPQGQKSNKIWQKSTKRYRVFKKGTLNETTANEKRAARTDFDRERE